MFKNALVFTLGATIGAGAYYMLTKTATVVAETIVETVTS